MAPGRQRGSITRYARLNDVERIAPRVGGGHPVEYAVRESLTTRQARWIDSWCSRTKPSAICRFADGVIAFGSGHP
jgi:hypothetical protein